MVLASLRATALGSINEDPETEGYKQLSSERERRGSSMDLNDPVRVLFSSWLSFQTCSNGRKFRSAQPRIGTVRRMYAIIFVVADGLISLFEGCDLREI